jgi:hypothetical protein
MGFSGYIRSKQTMGVPFDCGVDKIPNCIHNRERRCLFNIHFGQLRRSIRSSAFRLQHYTLIDFYIQTKTNMRSVFTISLVALCTALSVQAAKKCEGAITNTQSGFVAWKYADGMLGANRDQVKKIYKV